MKKGNCSECDKPLFDQNKDEKSELCDDCLIDCDHMCTSNCRREGCNCNCGEFHRISN